MKEKQSNRCILALMVWCIDSTDSHFHSYPGFLGDGVTSSISSLVQERTSPSWPFYWAVGRETQDTHLFEDSRKQFTYFHRIQLFKKVWWQTQAKVEQHFKYILLGIYSVLYLEDPYTTNSYITLAVTLFIFCNYFNRSTLSLSLPGSFWTSYYIQSGLPHMSVEHCNYYHQSRR